MAGSFSDYCTTAKSSSVSFRTRKTMSGSCRTAMHVELSDRGDRVNVMLHNSGCRNGIIRVDQMGEQPHVQFPTPLGPNPIQLYLVNIDQIDGDGPHPQPSGWSKQPMQRDDSTLFFITVHERQLGSTPVLNTAMKDQPPVSRPATLIKDAKLVYPWDNVQLAEESQLTNMLHKQVWDPNHKWEGIVLLVKQRLDCTVDGWETVQTRAFHYGDVVAVCRSNGARMVARIESKSKGIRRNGWGPDDVQEWLEEQDLQASDGIVRLLKGRTGNILLQSLQLVEGLSKMDMKQLARRCHA